MVELPLEQLLHFYRDMLRLRFFEEAVRDDLGPRGLIRGSAHLYIGQEAVGVGALHALLLEDYVLSSHRGHGHALARGSDPERVFAEILGRRTGLAKGKGGSMHLTDLERGFIGENPVVAASIPIAAGVALAAKQLGQQRVALVFFGEGAVNNGAFHEGLNLAALWKLPVVFLCENNRYAISVSLERSSALTDLHERGAAYNMRHQRLDGMDVGAVYYAVSEAAALARDHDQPSFLVANTYRFEGHYLTDTLRYRSLEEAQEMRRQFDPVHLLEQRMLEDCVLSPEELVDHRERERTQIQEALKRALAAAEPEAGEALEDIYL